MDRDNSAKETTISKGFSKKGKNWEVFTNMKTIYTKVNSKMMSLMEKVSWKIQMVVSIRDHLKMGGFTGTDSLNGQTVRCTEEIISMANDRETDNFLM
jgi:hypothetical protein